MHRLRNASVAFALTALVTTACSDPVQAYFEDAAAVIDTMRAESIAATPRAGEITRDGVVGVNEARRSAAGALGTIVPPDEVRPEHLALVTALDGLVAAVGGFLADTADLDPESFQVAVNEAADLQARATSVALACEALSERATSLGVDVDIRC